MHFDWHKIHGMHLLKVKKYIDMDLTSSFIHFTTFKLFCLLRYQIRKRIYKKILLFFTLYKVNHLPDDFFEMYKNRSVEDRCKGIEFL